MAVLLGDVVEYTAGCEDGDEGDATEDLEKRPPFGLGGREWWWDRGHLDDEPRSCLSDSGAENAVESTHGCGRRRRGRKKTPRVIFADDPWR